MGIVDDGTVELEEFFVGNLFGGPVDPRFTLSPDNANVTIVDDDSMFLGSNILLPICAVPEPFFASLHS